MKFNRMIVQWVCGIALLGVVVFSAPVYDFGVVFMPLGILLLFCGILGRLYATLYIGGMKNAGSDGKSFVSDGIYSVCRNPLYFFSFLGFLGLLLLKGEITLIVIGVIAYLVIYRITILGEEKFLSSQYGESYQKFLKTTPRFFPSFAKFKYNERLEIRPLFLHKEIKQSFVWLLFAFIIYAIQIAQEYEYLPILLNIF